MQVDAMGLPAGQRGLPTNGESRRTVGGGLWADSVQRKRQKSLQTDEEGLWADSVKRKRRKKMKKHQWKKRLKINRRKSKVSQGAKR